MASGDVLASWEAGAGLPPTSAFAALVRRNNHLVAAFDAAADESIDFEKLLRNYAAGGITATIVWMADTAVSGTVRWEGLFERHDTALDLDADSFAASQSAGGTAPGTAGFPVYTTLTFTNSQIDGLLNTEHFRFRLRRDADGTTGTDDMAGDAHLLAVELKET